MVSFRLTKEEYDRLRDLCFSNGVRSVSEMARVALNLLFHRPERAPQQSLEIRVKELEQRVHILSVELKTLRQPSASAPLFKAAAASAE
jgi:hypothetical protein